MKALRDVLGRPIVQHLLVVAGAALLFLPRLDMGLYDPWESHYAEVARRIDLDGDWITLRWHSDSRLADDVNSRCRHDPSQCTFFSKPVFIFWLMALSYRAFGLGDAAARLPIVLLGIAGLFGVYWYMRRIFGMRAGLLAAGVLASTPYYYLLSRQIMTDIAFVVPMTVGLLAVGHYLTDDTAKPRHLYLFYSLCGVATLAKGLLGFLLPGAVLFVFLVLRPSRFAASLKRLQVEKGFFVFLAVAGPWYAAVWATNGNAWFREFIVKHHLSRAGEGVHGERGTFEYFVDQLTIGLWPWLALVPAAVVTGWASWRRRLEGREGVRVLLLVWATVAFGLFTLTTTKFHHYVFPAVPPLMLLVALVVARAFEEPLRAVEKATVLAGVGLLAAATPIVVREPWRFINLFIYKYDRNYPEIEAAAGWLGAAVIVFGIGIALLLVHRLSRASAFALCAGALVAAGWNVQGFMIALEPTMSLRNAFEAYDRLREPDDRLYEWALRWRGEVWYSRDTSHEIPQDSMQALRRELGRPGRAFIATTSPDALDARVRRAFGRGVRVVNDRPDRYAMTLWEGPPSGSSARYVLREVPAAATQLGARLGSAVEVAAYEIRPERIRPGQEVEVVLYFRCLERLADEWTVYIHGDHPEEGRGPMRLLSDHPPADGLLPTTAWRPGQIVRDETRIESRADQRPGTYTFFVGLFRDEEGRMPVTSGPADSEGRLRLGSVVVGD